MQDNDNQQLNIESLQAEAQVQSDATQEATQQKRKLSKLWDVVLWVLIAVLAAALLLNLLVITRVTISGDSMNSTYKSDEVVWVVKVGAPERGDVVVFYKKDVDSKFKALFARGDETTEGGKYEKLIKRVVAVAGDKLWIEQVEGGYQVFVKTADGKQLREDYYVRGDKALKEERFILPNTPQGLGRLSDHVGEDNALVIEKDHFFAMGDNRGNSEDSRGELNQVSLSRVFGIVINR